MIVIVTGGRDFTDSGFLFAEMDRLNAELGITMVVEGGQRTYKPREGVVGGADYWAYMWAAQRGISVVREDAQWNDLSHSDAVIKTNSAGKKYDANAGPRRNASMLEKYHPDRVIAFAGGSGTADMCERARAAGVEVIEVAP